MPVSYDGVEPTIPEGYEPGDFRRHDIQLITKSVIPADRRRMASYVVTFDRMWWHDYFVETVHSSYIDYTLAPAITEWLEKNATDYIGADSLDRGDWGEGSPICSIDFAVEAECDAFIAEFQHTIHALVYTDAGINRRKMRETKGLE